MSRSAGRRTDDGEPMGPTLGEAADQLRQRRAQTSERAGEGSRHPAAAGSTAVTPGLGPDVKKFADGRRLFATVRIARQPLEGGHPHRICVPRRARPSTPILGREPRCRRRHQMLHGTTAASLQSVMSMPAPCRQQSRPRPSSRNQSRRTMRLRPPRDSSGTSPRGSMWRAGTLARPAHYPTRRPPALRQPCPLRQAHVYRSGLHRGRPAKGGGVTKPEHPRPRCSGAQPQTGQVAPQGLRDQHEGCCPNSPHEATEISPMAGGMIHPGRPRRREPARPTATARRAMATTSVPCRRPPPTRDGAEDAPPSRHRDETTRCPPLRKAPP